MPTLNWLGKEAVINHHNEVRFRTLDLRYNFGADAESANRIVHGDNLEALKALLPEYEGKVRCIYIDPPYNTGNENWVYNDNVNSDRISKWLGQVVGRESEDFSRHDKWLCMMYPRLQLLHKLLSDDGAIFISIDNNEYANLKLVCDEIFGVQNFVNDISWQRTYSTRNDSKTIVSEVEHILVFSKNREWIPNKLPRTAEMDAKYKNPDNDFAPWTSSDAFAADAATHQGMVYAIQHPFTGDLIYPSTLAHWRYSQDEMLRIMQGWCEYELRDIDDARRRAEVCGVAESDVREGVRAIMIKGSMDEAKLSAEKVLKRGQWPRFFFTKNGRGGIARKTYLDNVGGIPPTNLFKYDDCGHTDEAKKELIQIFDGKAPFDTPKPSRLIEHILKIATDKDSIVLDSFAGSGTTAHAVLGLNKRDGGHRKFVLVEMEDYADSVTAERAKRVIKGYADNPATGGDFSYYELGPALIDENGLLNESLSVDTIRKFVWYSETNSEYDSRVEDIRYYLGQSNDTDYYFYYEKDSVTYLTHDTLSIVAKKAGSYVIYADMCCLDSGYMLENHIRFKKIPRDIRRF